jgi:RNA polymerase sigma-70 factor (ECF subfamily)
MRSLPQEGGRRLVSANAETEELIARATEGDEEAQQRLLLRHKDRLRRMVAVRMDRRLVARLDPSDVVQEALADAFLKLPIYLRERPLPFYPWLRHIAWKRLLKLHQRHVHALKRSVAREEHRAFVLPHESAFDLAKRIADPGTSPSTEAARAELSARVRTALAQLSECDREVLILRYLEQLSTRETAAALGITDGAVKTRHLRALQRLRRALRDTP